ncbi:cytochrome c family protein [Sphingosinicella sp. CPCC 101087]|uniref:c-type cytochrome n=1 Tax=Sphingosinicella sp. CPCC 101087 TaxID=2497754 RepID=UPI001981FFB8|nr:c-type cytochrome [Sphingosinicella sp. CPCC 101087]
MRLHFGLAAAVAAAVAACGARYPAPSTAQGEHVYRQQCFSCHAVEAGGSTPAGPTLHGIIGRPIAGDPGFDYSPALRRLAERRRRWTPQLLDRFITDPESVAPGTEMGLLGIEDPTERRALIEWLRRSAGSP